jgi:hypothetical protein
MAILLSLEVIGYGMRESYLLLAGNYKEGKQKVKTRKMIGRS